VLNKYGRIDILINNAANDQKFQVDAMRPSSRLEELEIESWQKDIDVGLTGAMLCTKYFGGQMAKQGGGVIVNISSDLGLIAPDQRLYKELDGTQNFKPLSYSVVKHGLIGLTKYIATYWNDCGVRANTLCPGGVYSNQSDDLVEKLKSLIPMGRMANSDEYIGAIQFLCSPASSYMNGSTLVVDGGRTIW